MKVNYIKSFLMLFALSTAMISCGEDDQTGHSQTTPTSPSVSIDLGFTNPTLVEDDTEFDFTVTLSETQVVDVKLHVEQIGGTANSDDYELTSLISIPAGYTSATGTIKILTDDLKEDTETLKLSIGTNTTANASSTPVTTEITILNYTTGDLMVDMSWAIPAATTTDDGEEISATTFADMVLSISTTPDASGDIGVADGGSFESFTIESDTPDGTYYAVASFYDANPDIFRDIDLTVEFNQPGTINHESYDFAQAINNGFGLCDDHFFVLAKIVKTGDSYEIMPVGEPNPPVPSEGDWEITLLDAWGDGWDDAFITLSINGEETEITCDSDIFETTITVPADAIFVITYTAGSEYEEEHHYDIYAPDGTNYFGGSQWTGSNIAEGAIFDNRNPCL